MANLLDFKNGLGFNFTGTDVFGTSQQFSLFTGTQTWGDIWFKRSISGFDSFLIEKEKSFEFKINKNNKLELFISGNNSSLSITGTSNILNNSLYQAFFVFETSSNLSMYLNSNLEVSQTISVPAFLDNSTGTLSIGKLFSGFISNVSHWSGALTSGEIKTLYADGGGTYYDYNFSVNPTNATLNYISRVTDNGGFVLRPNQFNGGTGVLSAKFNSDGSVQKTYALTGVGGDVNFVNGTLNWNSGDDTFSIS